MSKEIVDHYGGWAWLKSVFTEAQIKLYQERVDRGWDWLEKNEPGWQEKVVIANVNMASGCLCIFGFVYGTYLQGINKVHTSYHILALGDWTTEHGFNALLEEDGCILGTTGSWAYSLLDQLWTDKLQKYLQQKTTCGENPFYLPPPLPSL